MSFSKELIHVVIQLQAYEFMRGIQHTITMD